MVVALLLPESAEQVTVESALMASMWPAPVQSLACTPPLEEAAGLGRRAEASVPLEMLAAFVVSVVAEAAKATPLVLVVVVAQAPAEVTVSPVSGGIGEDKIRARFGGGNSAIGGEVGDAGESAGVVVLQLRG